MAEEVLCGMRRVWRRHARERGDEEEDGRRGACGGRELVKRRNKRR